MRSEMVYDAMRKAGMPEELCAIVSNYMNTPYTSAGMAGYLKHVRLPSVEEVVDEMPALPGARILSFDEGEIHPIKYEEIGSYKIMKMFVEDRKRVLHHLLEL